MCPLVVYQSSKGSFLILFLTPETACCYRLADDLREGRYLMRQMTDWSPKA